MDYPKSVENVGLVGGKFVDENPTAGTPGSLIPAEWGNAITDELLNVITAAGLVPSEANTAQLLLAIRQINQSASTGVVGTARRLKTVVSAASASATFTADEIVLESALGGPSYRLANINKVLNLGTVGAGGMDTGTAPASGFVAVYLIYNPVSGASALLASNATSVAAPEVYGGANMPAGYTASALLSVAPVSATPGQFAPFVQMDRDIFINQYSVFNSTAAGPASYTPISLSAAIPLNARAAQVIWSVQQASAGSGVSMSIACNSSGLLSLGVQSVTTGGTAAQSFTARFPIVVAQTLYYMTNVSAAPRNAVISAYQI